MNNQSKFSDEQPKLSPFHERQAELNIRDAWSVWNGYKFADYYYEAEYEYFCIRNTCGTYDISPMQKYLIEGKNAESMLNRMVTRDISNLKINRVTYVLWCTNEGRVIDDGTIFKLDAEKFMLTCGSPNLAWLKKASYGFDNVKIEDLTDNLAALSLQGPTSYSVLSSMGLSDIDKLKPFDFMTTDLDGVELIVSRTGFTGDLGYELWIEASAGINLWDKLYAAGENYGIQPYGEAATNMARLEAGFIMPYMEFNEALKTVNFQHDQTPFELNLGWLVDFKKPIFNGKEALIQDKKNKPKYTLTKLDIEGNKPAEASYIYSEKECKNEIGYVTSAMWSPAVKANIAMAMIKTEYLDDELWVEIYYEKELRQYDKVVRCQVKDKPFWMPERAKLTPPEKY